MDFRWYEFPIRPLTERILEDLDRFAGVTRTHALYATLIAWSVMTIGYVIARPSVPAYFAPLWLLAFWWLVRIDTRRAATVTGPARPARPRTALWILANVHLVLTITGGTDLVAGIPTVAFIAVLATSPDQPDRGLPWLVRQWRRARSALAAPVPAVEPLN